MRRTLSALLVGILALGAVAATTAGDVTAELSPPDGQTAVTFDDELLLGGEVPAGSEPGDDLTATLEALDVDDAVLGTFDVTSNVTVDGGAVSGSVLVGCFYIPDCFGNPDEEAKQAAIDALRGYRLELTVDGVSDASGIVDFDDEPPLIASYALTSATTVLVRFSEDVTDPEGDAPGDWTVDGLRQVTSIGGTGNSRTLTFLTPQDDDATPEVRYSPTPSLDPSIPNVPYVDGARNELDADNRFSLAADEVPPPVPSIARIEGEEVTHEAEDEAVPVLGDEPTPTITVEDVPGDATAQVFLDADDDGAFEPDTDDTLIGEAAGDDVSRQAVVTSTVALGDGVHRFYARSVDDAECDPNDPDSDTCPNASGRSQEARYDLETAPPTIGTVLGRSETISVPFTEDVTGTDDAGQWSVTNGSGGDPLAITDVSGGGSLRTLTTDGTTLVEGATLTYTPPGSGAYADEHGNEVPATADIPIQLADLPLLTVEGVQGTEGDPTTLPDLDPPVVSWTLRLSEPLPAGETVEVTVDVVERDDDHPATPGDGSDPAHDHEDVSGTVTFATAGQQEAVVGAEIFGDELHEFTEDAFLEVRDVSGATLPDNASTLSTSAPIIDNDPAPKVAFADDSVSVDVDEGATTTLTVELDTASGKPVEVAWRTEVAADPAEGEAGPADVPADEGTVTVPAGQTTETFEVTVADDQADEPDETFQVVLSDPVSAELDDERTTITTLTIIDDDLPVPTLSVEPGSVDEGDALLPAVQGAQLPYTLTLSTAPEEPIEIGWRTTSGGTATPDVDFTSDSGAVRFEAGETEQTLFVEVFDDDLHEADETVGVRVVEPAGADLEGGNDVATFQGTILDDDVAPTVAFADGSVNEAVTEGHTATFTVELSEVSGRDTEVGWATVFDGTATTDDLPEQSDTVAIPAGQTTGTFEVTTIDNEDPDGDRTVSVELSEVTNAQLGDPSSSMLTIADDEVVTPVITLTGGEGNEDPGLLEPITSPTPVTFTVELSRAAEEDVTLRYRTTSGGEATAESDFTATSGTLTIPAGDTSGTVPVEVLDDDLHEFDETVELELSQPTNARFGDGGPTLAESGTILDDDDPVTVSIGDATVGEGESVVVDVTLDTESGRPVEVDYATADASAMAGSDYDTASGTVTFEPGETTKQVTVQTLDDAQVEGDEGFRIALTDPVNAELGDDEAVVTITDDDEALPNQNVLSISSATQEEGDPPLLPFSPPATLDFTVSLRDPADGDVEVSWEAASDFGEHPATAGEDFEAGTGTVTIPDGQQEATIAVEVTPDLLDEYDETMVLTIAGATGDVVVPGGQLTRTGRILDDDQPAAIAYAEASAAVEVTEGAKATLTVELDTTSGKDVAVTWTSSYSGTATTDDAPSQSNTVTVPAGETTATFEVETTDNGVRDGDRDFSVVLSDPQAATLSEDAPTTAAVTILDDDLPVLSIEGGSVDEAAVGTLGSTDPGTGLEAASVGPIRDADSDASPGLVAAAVSPLEEDLGFTVSLAEAFDQDIAVRWTATDRGTATAGSDYTAASGTLEIPAGETEGEVLVDVVPDDLDEFDETVVVRFSDPQGARFADGVDSVDVAGTIVDDDPLVTVDLGEDQEVSEGEPATFAVTLSAVSGKDITLRYRTSDGSATAGQDYTATDDTLTIPTGDTSATFTIPTSDDATFEPTEDLSVQLSVVEDDIAELGRSTGTLTITDDDLGVSPNDTVVSLTGDAVEEGDPATPLPLPLGGNSLVFEIRLSEPADGDVVIDYETRAGTATADDDFVPASDQVTIPDGQESATVSIAVVGDFADEFDEDLQLVLTGVSGDAVIPGGELARTGRIIDDDATAQLRVSDATVLEGGVAELDVTLDNASGKDITVGWALVDGSATAGDDYVDDSGTLSFPAGTTSQTVEVATLADDDTGELIEQFELVLSGATNAGIDDGRGTISIVDIGADGLPTATAVFLKDTTTQEGDSDRTALVPVRLSSPSDQDTTVTWSSQQLTATAGEDYRAEGGQVTIPAGETEASIPVTIIGDTDVEADEDFLVLLTEAQGAVITGPTGRVTIEEDGDGDGDGGNTPGGGDGADGAPDGGDGELPATGGGAGLALVGLAALLARRRRD